jgi:hypothetical protein
MNAAFMSVKHIVVLMLESVPAQRLARIAQQRQPQAKTITVCFHVSVFEEKLPHYLK